MVGYDPKEGTLLGIEILSMTETPALGQRYRKSLLKASSKENP